LVVERGHVLRRGVGAEDGVGGVAGEEWTRKKVAIDTKMMMMMSSTIRLMM
jgi:hypothetical protein